MNISNYYYYFVSAVPERICDDIVKYGYASKDRQQQAITGGFGRDRDLTKQPLEDKELKDIKKKRDSNIIWMNDPWIYRELHPYIHEANKQAGWNYEWDHSESCQFTIYGKGQYYGWHCDSWDKPYSRPPLADGTRPIDHGKIRKLSVTISLSHPDEYVGGNLEFDFRNQVDWENNKKEKIHSCEEIRPRGSIIVFPSFVWHRVAPVTRGTRYSLVVWNLGYPWR